MKLFDLHCDTAGECAGQRLPLFDNNLQLNICKGKSLDKWAQLFAVWIPDNLRGKAAEEYFDGVYEYFMSQIAQNACDIRLCSTFDDMNSAFESNKCAAFLTVEGASAAVGEGRLEWLKSIGVKLITLTWNGINEIGCGAVTGEEIGLTPLGRQFVKELSRLNIIADVSHLNRKGFYELLTLSDGAIIASHSDCAAVLRASRADSIDREMSVRRSLDDEQIKLLIERKALIGINLCRSFLGDPGDDGCEAVRRHMEHILDLGGEGALAFGSDFDGCEINSELDSVDKTEFLRDYLRSKGFGSELLDKIFFENAHNFFKSVLQRG